MTCYGGGDDLQFASLADDLSRMPSDITIKLHGGCEVSANRTILAARSVVFKTMLFGEMQEAAKITVELPETVMCVNAVIEWASTGYIKKTVTEHTYNCLKTCFADQLRDSPANQTCEDLTQEINGQCIQLEEENSESWKELCDKVQGMIVSLVCEILVASDKYDMPLLKTMCCSILCTNLRAHYVCSILVCASTVNADHLKKTCLKFTADHRHLVQQAGGFDELSKELVLDVLLA